jgi:hypothetical protein
VGRAIIDKVGSCGAHLILATVFNTKYLGHRPKIERRFVPVTHPERNNNIGGVTGARARVGSGVELSSTGMCLGRLKDNARSKVNLLRLLLRICRRTPTFGRLAHKKFSHALHDKAPTSSESESSAITSEDSATPAAFRNIQHIIGHAHARNSCRLWDDMCSCAGTQTCSLLNLIATDDASPCKQREVGEDLSILSARFRDHEYRP